MTLSKKKEKRLSKKKRLKCLDTLLSTVSYKKSTAFRSSHQHYSREEEPIQRLGLSSLELCQSKSA